MYYSSFGILALLLTAIINYNILKARENGGNISAKSKYKHFIICIMAYYITDICWGFFYEFQLVGLAYADTVIYFLTMALSVLLWTMYIVAYLNTKNLFSKVLTYLGFLFLIFEVIVLFVNFFVHVVFTFDANNVYQPKDSRYITLIAQIALFIAVSVYTLIGAFSSHGKEKRQCEAIAFSGIIMIVFIILQSFFPLLPFYAIGLLIATCVVNTFITNDEIIDYDDKLGSANRKVYTDPLTSVKSAHAYLEDVAKIVKRMGTGELKEFSVAVFDLNGLKQVNDKFGHDAGNKYLQDASQLICKLFKHSPVYRIGGDEFVAILQGEDFNNRVSLMGALIALPKET